MLPKINESKPQRQRALNDSTCLVDFDVCKYFYLIHLQKDDDVSKPIYTVRFAIAYTLEVKFDDGEDKSQYVTSRKNNRTFSQILLVNLL